MHGVEISVVIQIEKDKRAAARGPWSSPLAAALFLFLFVA